MLKRVNKPALWIVGVVVLLVVLYGVIRLAYGPTTSGTYLQFQFFLSLIKLII